MTTQSAGQVNLPLIAAIVGVATIGGFMFGYDSGAINGTQEGLKTTFNLSEGQLGLTVSALLPGCAVGAFLAGRLADVWGRRKVMLVERPGVRCSWFSHGHGVCPFFCRCSRRGGQRAVASLYQ
jgi:MFS family permease